MKFKQFTSLFLFFTLSLLFACKKESVTTCDTSNVTYTNHIKSLFATCAVSGCHDAKAVEGSLASYQDIKNFPKLLKIIPSLKHQVGFVAMPQGQAQLSDCEISKVQAWFDNAMPE